MSFTPANGESIRSGFFALRYHDGVSTGISASLISPQVIEMRGFVCSLGWNPARAKAILICTDSGFDI